MFFFCTIRYSAISKGVFSIFLSFELLVISPKAQKRENNANAHVCLFILLAVIKKFDLHDVNILEISAQLPWHNAVSRTGQSDVINNYFHQNIEEGWN